ncbi:MAG: MipA/OmpV family protein [Mariprofundus sp.]|nr:MipA/OmpV family protein [Mariprofundus sp.]
MTTHHRYLPIFAVMIGTILTLPTAAIASEKSLPVWEFGVGAGLASLPQYMGSDERYTLAAPLPFLIYRGERINLDRSGLRAKLFDIDGLSIDASLGAGLPVRNSNKARIGMDSLAISFEAGPRINWTLASSIHSSVSFRLPWRAGMDIKGKYIGWISEPGFIIEYAPRKDLNFRISPTALFASEKYNARYYSVAPQYVTAKRAAYRATAGLHSLSIGTSATWAINDHLRAFGTIRYRNLTAGVIAGSPLVKTPHYLFAAIGFAWSFYQSDAQTTSKLEDDLP